MGIGEWLVQEYFRSPIGVSLFNPKWQRRTSRTRCRSPRTTTRLRSSRRQLPIQHSVVPLLLERRHLLPESQVFHHKVGSATTQRPERPGAK